jgi:hypothetical protein
METEEFSPEMEHQAKLEFKMMKNAHKFQHK